MKGVIMAGGFGTRLKPLTINRPKPMVPVANLPMMHHIVGLLKPGFAFTSPVEMVLPHALTSNGYVKILIHPAAAQTQRCGPLISPR